MKECAQCHLCYDDEVLVCPADQTALHYTLPGSVQIADKYRLERLIARASMGSVYKAMQQDLQRPVAIKVLNPQLLASNIARERFRREALAVASLKHPHIVTVFDFGANPYGLFYIAMELLEGRTLSDRLMEEKRLDIAEAVRIALEICDALAQAHSGGIIHRDLKPSNIFLSRDSSGEKSKVIDFGLVKLKERADAFKSITAGALIGSLHYSAPEQHRSVEVDARADIYSLGVILYHMLTGRRPFDAPSKAQVIYEQLNTKPLPPHRIIFDIPPALEMLVLKAMEKDPSERFQTISDFARALQQAPKRAARRTVGLFVSSQLAHSKEQAQKEFQQATQRALCFEHFVARKRELSRLQMAFEQASEGRQAAILITGDPGIGKTRLIAGCLKELGEEGALCFTGQFTNSLSTPWALTNLRLYLQQLLAGDPAGFNKIFGPTAQALQEAISVTNTAATTEAFFEPREGPQAERSMELLAQAYILLSEQQPVVIALDDLHDAEETGLNFLMYLIGAAPRARIMLLFSARAQEIARPGSLVAHWLDRMANQRQLQRLPLGPLSTADLRLLVEKIFDPVAISEEVISRLWQATEGNPFHLVSVLRLMVEQRQITWDEQQWQFSTLAEIKIPDSVARLIEARFSFLSPESRKMLESAAILGETFSFEALKRFTGMEEDELLRIIDDGLRYALLREVRAPEGGSPQDDYYGFAQHALYQFLYEGREAGERREDHLKAARIFAAMSAERGTEEHIEAARQYLLSGRDVEAFCHQMAAATAVWRAGDVQPARKYLQTAGSIAERLDILNSNPYPFGQTVESDIDNATFAGHFCDYLMLSVDLKLCSDPGQAEEWLERALLLAQRVGEPTLIARSLVAAGHYQQNQGDYMRALGYFERAMALYEEAGNKQRYNIIIEQVTLLKAKVKPRKPTADIL
jgi:eukaryotic-like serine/threonine-protein kinase